MPTSARSARIKCSLNPQFISQQKVFSKLNAPSSSISTFEKNKFHFSLFFRKHTLHKSYNFSVCFRRLVAAAAVVAAADVDVAVVVVVALAVGFPKGAKA